MNSSSALKAAGRLAFSSPSELAPRVKEAHRRRYFRDLTKSWDLWYELFYENDPPGMTRAEFDKWSRDQACELQTWMTANSNFLDLGCGDGRILKLVAPHCRSAHGADVSGLALRHARRNCREIPNVRLHEMTDWGLPFESSELDLVFCHFVLSHMDIEPAIECLKEIRRVLKPQGRCIFNLHHLLYEGHLAGLMAPRTGEWPGIQRPRFWTAEMVRALIPRCGFRIEQLKGGRFIEIRAKRL